MREVRKLVVRNKDKNYNPVVSTKTVIRPTATELLNQALGNDWQTFYNIEKLSTVLTRVFNSRGWSISNIQKMQREYWVEGYQYIKNGNRPKSPTAYNVVNVIQWHLDRS